MTVWLKQSTAVDIGIGPFLDDTDGKTAETGLTITQPDIRLKKNGGAWAQKSAAQTLSHEENGWYELALSTTDTNTLGVLIVNVSEAGALPVWADFMVVPANVWDTFFGADNLDVSVIQWLGTAVTADTAGRPNVNSKWLGNTAQTGRDVGASVLLSTGTGAGQLDFASGVVKANLVQILASAITGTAAQLVAAFTKFFNVASPTGTINSIPDAVPDAVGGLPITGTRLTAIPDVITIKGYLDTEIAAILAAVDTEIAALLARIPSALTAGGLMRSSVEAFFDDAADAADLLGNVAGIYAQIEALGLMYTTIGQAQAGSTTSNIVLAATENAGDNALAGQIILNKNKKEARLITANDATTKIAAVFPDWLVAPVVGDYYTVLPAGALSRIHTDAIADLLADPGLDTYGAKISVTRSPGHNIYEVVWFKNDEPADDITDAVIQVVKESDGTDLVAEVAMVEIGGTEKYSYDEDTNLMINGEAYIAMVQATIDGATRQWATGEISKDA